MNRKWVFIWLLIMFFPLNGLCSKLNIVYPNTNEEGSNSFAYLLLKLALEKSGTNFTLKMPKVKINNSRARKMLEENEISICDFGTSPEFEDQFLPIYFPMYRGLLGHRMFIINKKNKQNFEKINSLNSLASYTAGQGIGWFDSKILEQGKLKVFLAPHLKNLFSMVKFNRIDYLPLGVNEIHGLLDKQNYDDDDDDLYIVPNILLIYPFARFYFVHKDNKKLRNIIRDGLLKAFKDGSYQKLLDENQDFVKILSTSRSDYKLILNLKNPFTTEKFKNIPKKFFYQLK